MDNALPPIDSTASATKQRWNGLIGNTAKSRVLIVGAGSIGMTLGYNLTLAKADVIYLVRPGRLERLNRPQMLYRNDDNSLKQFTGYEVFSNRADIAKEWFDLSPSTVRHCRVRTAKR